MIRTLIHFLIDPLMHFVFVLLIAALCWKWQNKRWGKNLFYYALGWFFLIAISPIPAWLTEIKESQYPVFHFDDLGGIDTLEIHVLVLGGGHTNAPALPPNDQLSPSALGRLVEGVRIFRLLPHSKLVCSGYSSTRRTPQAEVLAQTALLLGVAPQDTFLIPTAVNTEAEARDYTARFGPDNPLILVTSATHMPRAMFWFRQMGCEPIAAPTNHLIKLDPDHKPFPLKPSIRKIEMTKSLLHEYVGMWYARWKTG